MSDNWHKHWIWTKLSFRISVRRTLHCIHVLRADEGMTTNHQRAANPLELSSFRMKYDHMNPSVHSMYITLYVWTYSQLLNFFGLMFRLTSNHLRIIMKSLSKAVLQWRNRSARGSYKTVTSPGASFSFVKHSWGLGFPMYSNLLCNLLTQASAVWLRTARLKQRRDFWIRILFVLMPEINRCNPRVGTDNQRAG